MQQLIIPFSQKGMDDLSKKLSVLSSKEMERLFIERSLIYLKSRAMFHVQSTVGKGGYPITNTLLNSFEINVPLKQLYNSCRYSAFVEYGTGAHGISDAETGYIANLSQKGTEGWWYIGDDGNSYFTHGLEPHRFMFNAVQDYIVGGEYKKIFNACFNTLLGGVK